MTEELNDKLNRKDEAKFLINYLTKRYEVKNKENSFVLNVNAKWGYGKTFFLHLIEKELEKKEHEVIFFDAWKNDFTKEPLLAFFSEINDSLEKYFKKRKSSEAKKIFKLTFAKSLPLFVSILTKHLTGLSAEEFGDLLTEDKDSQSDEEENSEIKKDTQNTLSSIMSKATEIALQEHKTLKNSIETFRNNMKLLIKEIEKENNIKLPLFILIDELDRCRPNYAIELLENIKHIFDIKGIYFIIATNSKQLSHSINAIYGANFSSEVYLKRFFDQEYSLKEPDKYEYIEFLYEKEIYNKDLIYTSIIVENKDKQIFTIEYYSKFFKLGLRDIKQIIDMLSTISLTWDTDEEIHLPYLLYFIITNYKYNELFNKSKNKFDSQIIREDFPKYKFDNSGFSNIKITDLILTYTKILGCNVKEEHERKNKITELLHTSKNEERQTILPFKENRLNKIEKLLEYPNIVKSAAQLK